MGKQKILLGLLVILCHFVLIFSRKYDCKHHSNDLKVLNDSESSDNGNRRNLDATWSTIRMTYSTDDLDNLPTQFQYVKYFIQKQMNLAVKFFEDSLKVIPNPLSTLIIDDDKCGELTIPTRIRTTGVSNSDIHILIGYFDDSTGEYSGTLAYAGPCYVGSSSVQGRVVMGRVLYNLAFLKSGLDALLKPLEFEDQFETTVHELTHVLGFSSSTAQYWWNTNTNAIYGSSGVSTILTTSTFRGLSTNILRSTNVLAAAKEHFGCTTLTGMQMENQGSSGSVSAHWESTISYGETMGPQAISHDSSYTKLTFALLQDTNWFQLQDGLDFDYLDWGNGKGCDFFTNACASTTTTYAEFSYNNGNSGSCGFDNYGVSVRSAGDYTDECRIYRMYSNTLCQDTSNSVSSDSIYLNYFNSQSRCFMSTIVQSGYSSPYTGRCFQSECTKSGSVWTLKIKPQASSTTYREYTFLSTADTANQQVGQRQTITFQSSVSGANATYSGYIEAPLSIAGFCSAFTDSCPNFCSGNGYCRAGTCHCLTGYSGTDCSVESCSDYYVNDDQSQTTTCVDECPSGYYGSTSRYCIACDASCTTCDGPTSSDCTAGIILYLNKIQLLALLLVSFILFRS